MRARISTVATLLFGALAACSDGGARDPDSVQRVDLDREQAEIAHRLDGVRLVDVIASAAGVPKRDAATRLEGWLRASGADGEALLSTWPRRGGALDLDRAPIAARSVTGTVSPGDHARCGDVMVLFRGDKPPTVRVRFELPATSKTCRSAKREAPIDGVEAFDALEEAMAAVRVPEAVLSRQP